MNDKPQTRIRFEHERGTERLWAEEAGEGRYRLLNSPWFVYGVSFGDLVLAGEPDEGGTRPFIRVTHRSGGSTYRIFVQDVERFEEFWGPIQEAGCTFEQARERLYAIDVPPWADVDRVYGLLESGEAAGVWEFEEGHCGHPPKE